MRLQLQHAALAVICVIRGCSLALVTPNWSNDGDTATDLAEEFQAIAVRVALSQLANLALVPRTFSFQTSGRGLPNTLFACIGVRGRACGLWLGPRRPYIQPHLPKSLEERKYVCFAGVLGIDDMFPNPHHYFLSGRPWCCC